MDTRWRIELLGRLRATQGDRVVTRFRAQKGGALLAYLAYHLDRPHPREELIELFWPTSEPSHGRNSLSRELSSLRCQLEPPGVPSGAVIVADRACVRLNPAACTTDVLEFEAALEAAAPAGGAAVPRPWSPAKVVDPGSLPGSPSHASAERRRCLIQAADRYGGELLPGYFESWIVPERQRLADAYLQLLEELVAHHEQDGDLHGALQYAWRAVAADALREESQYHLIRLLVLNGQPAAALQQYQELERRLASELGVQPAPELQSLAGKLQRRAEAAAPSPVPGPLRRAAPRRAAAESSEAAPVRVTPEITPTSASTQISPSSASPVPAGPEIRLPIEFTRFFGREEELDRLQALLGQRIGSQAATAGGPRAALTGSPRLVTLTGPGGSGKTRLALQAARRIAEQDQRPVCSVLLADLADARLLGDKIAVSLGLPRLPAVPPMEQVIAFLSHRAGSARAGEAAAGPLLVLDNFEHLVAEGSGLVRELLERVPSLTCLVTSRQPLALAGEQEFPVAPLPVPVEGLGLRVEGSSVAADPSTLNPQLSTLMQCPSIALFVDRAQAVRPEFQLRPGNAAAVAALCARLEGLPLALELAAARVGVLTPAQMLGHLEQRFDFLVSRKRDSTPRHRSLRATLDWSYQLLSPALQRFFARLSIFQGGWTLEAAEAVCEEPQALHYLEQLRECTLVQAEETGGEMRFRLLETLREFGAEHLGPEERAALAHRHASCYLALADRAEPELVRAEQMAWLDRLERDLENLRAALAWLGASGRIQEALRLGGALRRFWYARGGLVEGLEWLKRLLALPGAEARTSARSKALNGAGLIANLLGDRMAAHSLSEESLAIGRELGDRWNIALSLTGLGLTFSSEGNFEAARSLLEEGLAIWREVGDPWGIDRARHGLGWVAYYRRDYGAALALCQECLRVRSEQGDRWGIANLLRLLGSVAREKGEYEEARRCAEQSLSLAREFGDRHTISLSLFDLGHVAYLEGDLSAARALLEESLTLAGEVGDKAITGWNLVRLAEVVADEGDPDTASACLEEAISLGWRPGELSSVAWSLRQQGQIAQQRGDPLAARRCFVESLAGAQAAGIKREVANCLEGLAAVAADEGQPDPACRLFAAAAALRESYGRPLAPIDQLRYEQHRVAVRAALGEETFAAAWAAGRAMTPDEAVSVAVA